MKRILIVVCAVLLVASPFLLGMLETGQGTDDKAIATLKVIDPSYQPWATSPGLQSSEIMQRVLFSFQIFAGLVLFAVFYYLLNRKNTSRKKEQ